MSDPSFWQRWRRSRPCPRRWAWCMSGLRCLYLDLRLMCRRSRRSNVDLLRRSRLLRAWVVRKCRMPLHWIGQRYALRSWLRLLPFLVRIPLCLLGVRLLNARI